MKQVKQSVEVSYTCDCCGKTVKGGSGWFHFQFVGDVGVLLLEKITKVQSYKVRNISDRAEKDYCGLDCARKDMTAKVNEFLTEVKPPRNRGKAFKESSTT